jgi:hypothetical protein
MPDTAAVADFGPWHFAVTAVGNPDFREVYSFRSRRACEEQRSTMQREVARVAAEHGDTTVGRFARRLHLGRCGTVRRSR